MTKTSEYRFFNLPRKYTDEDYETALNKITTSYSKINNVLAIYSFAGKFVPGISDMDLIFVHKKNPKKLPLLKRGFYFLDKKTRYLARHPFFHIYEDDFEKLNYIYPKSQYEKLFGKELKIRNISASEENLVRISLFNDIIIRHYPRDFLQQHIKKKINVRDTLLRLNSLKYSAKFITEITKTRISGIESLLKRVGGLRENWFELEDYEELADLHESALNITMEFIRVFDEFLLSEELVNIESEESINYLGQKNQSEFCKDWESNKSLKEMGALARNGKLTSILPLSLAPQIIGYSRNKGLISSYIKKNLEGEINYKSKLTEIAAKRISILNGQAELAQRTLHSDFAAFFDFGYSSNFGVNNRTINLIKGITR
ncbi:MAG TPA: hypothetical protein VI564_08720 [Candidatus Nanoarchaeia archaeon]|nr:hypothetical protein [Candidatus Nanoarchaeia archaeon]